jgi:hypothetical protein
MQGAMVSLSAEEAGHFLKLSRAMITKSDPKRRDAAQAFWRVTAWL